MLKKLHMLTLLGALVLLPAIQAAGHGVGSMDAGTAVLSSMMDDCSQMTADHCADVEACFSDGHIGCDGKAKLYMDPAKSAGVQRFRANLERPPIRYLSLHTERLLRPPRNA